MLFASFAFAAMGAGVKLASPFYSTSELVMYRGGRHPRPVHHDPRCRAAASAPHFPRPPVAQPGRRDSLWMWFYAIGKLPLATAVTLNYMAPIWMATWLFFIGWWHAKGQVEVAAGAGRGPELRRRDPGAAAGGRDEPVAGRR
jgi:hypothetical protein